MRLSDVFPVLESSITPTREVLEEAEYKGKKVTLNKPFRLSDDSPKKFGVYVLSDAGNVKLLKFGDANMSIKRDDPEARKSFRARHQCDSNPPKNSARYWSCKFWSTKNVSDLV
jgi:hypothetical protein